MIPRPRPKHIYIIADEAGISLWNKGSGIALDENGHCLNGGTGPHKLIDKEKERIISLAKIQEVFLIKELNDTKNVIELLNNLEGKNQVLEVYDY